MAFPVPPPVNYQQLIAALSQQMAQQKASQPDPSEIFRGGRPNPGEPQEDWGMIGGGTQNAQPQDPNSPGQFVLPTMPRPDGGYSFGNRSFHPATSPSTVFHAMRQALPAATKSNLVSHRDALIQRFMQQRGASRNQ